ncbi:MAG: DUF72 domain-containing protein [Candidatus Latescibacterota bacterium]
MKTNIYIGPAGWSYPDWEGIVYPRHKSKSFDPLAFIASYFNLVEINSTFYRIPDPAVTRKWTERVEGNPALLFTVKMFRNFTHEQGAFSQRDLNAFVRAVTPIHHAGKLGFVLIQFPWSFRYTADARKIIARLVTSLSPLPVAIEVRHGSWDNKEALCFIADSGATLCAIDQPQIGQSLTPATHHAGPSGAYFRLHGRNAAKWFGHRTTRDERYDYSYSQQELAQWAEKISQASLHGKRTFVVMNNHFRGQAVANAFELTFQLRQEKVLMQRSLIDAFPQLKEAAKRGDEHAPLAPDSERLQGDLFGPDLISGEEDIDQ